MHARVEYQELPSPSPQFAPATLTGVRVFVAEDEPILLMALEDALTDLGCTVVGSAGRVKNALDFVAGHDFDIAVLDGSLADGNVDPVVDVLVARGTPFVIASGFTSSHFSDSFSSAVFVRKPYSEAELGQAMLSAFEKKQLARVVV